MAAPNLVITPPTIARERESSADAAIVLAMAGQVSESAWVTDAAEYKEYDDASKRSQVYRRALSKASGVPVHQIKTKTWGVDAKGVILSAADEDKPGKWYFALSFDKSRQKRTRKRPATA